MRPIPHDPLNPGDDGLPEDYTEDVDIPENAPALTDDKGEVPFAYPWRAWLRGRA